MDLNDRYDNISHILTLFDVAQTSDEQIQSAVEQTIADDLSKEIESHFSQFSNTLALSYVFFFSFLFGFSYIHV